MQKKKINNNKGIALITLVVATLMMLVISSIIIFNTTSHIKVNNLNNMYNDIRVLNEQVFLYYSKYNELPVITDKYEELLDYNILGIYNTDEFHIIDINKIDRNLSSNLKYGADYYNENYTGTDIYIINITTHQIFYVQGISVDDKTYYTIPNENNNYTVVQVDDLVANPPELKSSFKPIVYNEQNEIMIVNNYDRNWYDYSENSDLSKWARAKIIDTEMYMWIPRYAYNTETNEIIFLKGITDKPIQENKELTDGNWVIPDAFQSKEKEQLTGIWLEIGSNYKKINNIEDLIKSVYELTGKDNINGITNTSIIEADYTYYNPVIPIGFRTVPTRNASWCSTNGIQVDGWNDGLVIENSQGNRFIWVPEITTNSVENETAQEQINKYGGYYKSQSNELEILNVK